MLREWLFRPVISEIRRAAMRMRGTSAVSLRLVRMESEMALVYAVSAAPVVDHDVVARRLTVVVNGETNVLPDFPPTATDFGEVIMVQEGDSVAVFLQDVDDAGNVSEPATTNFTAADTIPPVMPGSFGVALVREIPDVQPEPEVAVDPEVDPEVTE